MKKFLKYGFIASICMAMIPLMSSCDDDDITSNLKELIYPTYVKMSVPTEWDGYIYKDATETDNLPLIVGQTVKMGYEIPEESNYRTMVWESSNPSVATVDAEGNINAISVGETLITVHPEVYNPGSGISSTMKILVVASEVPATKVEISFSPRDEYFVGDNLQLSFIINPDYSTYKTVRWTSSNEGVAAVDKKGLVSFKAKGKVEITATSMTGDISDRVSFEVKTGQAPTSVTFENVEKLKNLAYGEKVNLKNILKMVPEDATMSMIDWSDADGLTSVDANGILSIKYLPFSTPLTMIDRTIELVASDRNGNRLGSVEVSIDGGKMIYHFEDGLSNLPIKMNEGSVYSQKDGYAHFEIGGTKYRQDIPMASTNGKGGFYFNVNKYKYFAIKIRRPYYYDESTDSYYSCKPGTTDGWRYNKFALNLTPTQGSNKGHQSIGKELDMTGDAPVLANVTWNGQAKVYVMDLSEKLADSADPATGMVDMKNVDLIVADFLASGVPVISEASYDIYWFGTFESLEAIQEYYKLNK